MTALKLIAIPVVYFNGKAVSIEPKLRAINRVNEAIIGYTPDYSFPFTPIIKLLLLILTGIY